MSIYLGLLAMLAPTLMVIALATITVLGNDARGASDPLYVVRYESAY